MSSNKSILLVEDDKYIAMALRIRLLAHQYQVDLAASVDEAKEMAGRAMPDVAVLDINLPDGNGIELMKLLHAMHPASPVPVIVMTASKSVGLRESAIQEGAIQFIEKPFRSSDLIEILDSALVASTPNRHIAAQIEKSAQTQKLIQ